MLAGKRILLVVAGGIAAYKSLDLIRRLHERGVAVRCILTKAAQEFVTATPICSIRRTNSTSVTSGLRAKPISLLSRRPLPI